MLGISVPHIHVYIYMCVLAIWEKSARCTGEVGPNDPTYRFLEHPSSCNLGVVYLLVPVNFDSAQF